MTAVLKVLQDNYGAWRWFLVDGGDVTYRQGPFDTGDEAVDNASTAMDGLGIEGYTLFFDGQSGTTNTVLPPPRIDPVAEAKAAGLTPTVTPEQAERAEKVRAELIEKQKDADRRVEETKKKIAEQVPDIGMEEPPDENPIAKQRKRRNATIGE